MTYLQGTLFDVRHGAMHREARLRLSGGLPPPAGLSALAAFLMTGRPSALVAATKGGEPRAQAPVAAEPDLRVPPRAGPSGFVELQPWRGSAFLRWSPVAAAGVAVGLGAVSAWSAARASSAYGRANGLLEDGSLRLGTSPGQYDGHISDGNSARSLAVGSGVAAGVALAASGVLGYLGYRESREIGPFRF